MVGGMGVGKTTVGRLLAAELGWRFVDSDAQILASTGMSARQIALTEGVDRLHVLEFSVLEKSLRLSPPPVIAAAASVVDHHNAPELLASGICCWIDRDPGKIEPADHRRDVDASEMLDLRRNRYATVADVTLSGAGTPEEYVATILEYLGTRNSRDV